MSSTGSIPPLLTSRSSSVFVHSPSTDYHATLWPAPGTVFWRIWPAVLFHTAFCAFIVCITELTAWNLAVPGVMLVRPSPFSSARAAADHLLPQQTVLGLVVGFGISWRASQGYANFQEGRQQWAQVTRISRTLGRLCWIHVPEELDSSSRDGRECRNALLQEDKRKFIGKLSSSSGEKAKLTSAFTSQGLSRRLRWPPSMRCEARRKGSSMMTCTPSSHGFLRWATLLIARRAFGVRSPFAFQFHSHSPAPSAIHIHTSYTSSISTSPVDTHLDTSPRILSVPSGRSPSRASSPFPLGVQAAQEPVYGTFTSAYSLSAHQADIHSPSQPLLPSQAGPPPHRAVIWDLLLPYALFKSFRRSQASQDEPLGQAASTLHRHSTISRPHRRARPTPKAKVSGPHVLGGVRKFSPEVIHEKDGNLPLAILAEMSSYVGGLEGRGVSGAVTGGMYAGLQGLEEALTGELGCISLLAHPR